LAQFDVHRLASGEGLVLDCQSDLLHELNTRFVAPLIPREQAPAPAQRLNPVFAIGDAEFVMVTQFAAAVQRHELGDAIASMRERSFEVVGALDVLISGV
jgi:toxin CcdB